ncbi:choline transporter-like protein 1 isoform X1 [Ruditapes philippinarum]|uniref:choline transporter-like protein 1 isoform X1 n=1 Tax=Ruditapes philippinarum TaxID=129788 RepID=UPI00295B0308|nr:choline transporter-like protein 1 isoform X1 [Ruditapes philippinarum]XP_060578388.1 choline transporter-like protein 1 isoform X1 [Ruditapes philippinarum]XP_060578389.1 choline transporter-like protein 1 isoform X1 [Ruditapes philippinarum]XP_060578390.1 choline transporter-like protein 1 isoform X1 [Ruditapes philippinarum]XP_060578392.1 choline transporter-like protein 1 isoform X1 [Ruditapes philippinarum]XP_060578393.1 choline transporter-like protein 1 isoform X1 [Ruditapes philippi
MCGCCGGGDENEDRVDLQHPVKNRGCTDLLVLILFVLFWAGMIFIAAFGIIHGDAFRLVYGYDSFGNTCDADNSDRKIENVTLSGRNMKGRRYVFFMDVQDPFRSKCICVNRCPEKKLDNIEDVKLFSTTTGSELCEYGIKPDDYPSQRRSKKGPCPVTPVLASRPLLNRCIPTNLISLASNVSSDIISFLNTSDLFQKVLSDLYSSWKEMLVLCFVAVAFSGVMVLLIRFLASAIVWVILAVAILGSIAGTAFLWWTYYGFRKKLEEDDAINLPLLDVEINSERAFLIYSIIATVLTVILLLVILVMRKRISLVVALFHEAGACMAAMPCLLLQPVWTFLILMGFFMYWVIVLAFLSTAEKPSMNADGYVTYKEHETVSYMWWYHLVGLIWTSEFIIACQQLVICGSVATWYFARDKDNLGCPIMDSIKLLVFHHLGSVAFGALIITAVKLPRMILMYLHKKFKDAENKCAEYCMKCCICCLWCLEKCLKYLNQNAYTIVAIEGTNFCKSAVKSFTTLVTNALRVAAINSVGDFILFLGKIGVMAATAAVGLLWFKSRSDLHYYAVPVLLVCVFSYLIASSFLSTYEMVIDAMLLCFCHDCDINDGSAANPYFAGESLMDFVDGTSKSLNAMRIEEKSGEEAEAAQV